MNAPFTPYRSTQVRAVRNNPVAQPGPFGSLIMFFVMGVIAFRLMGIL